MDTQIQKVEKSITKRIKDEWTLYTKKMEENQHNRNRNIVKEIMETCSDFTTSMDEYFNKLADEIEEPWML